MKKVVFSVILSCILVSCGSGRIDSLKRKSNEAIVIAKVKVVNNQEDETKDCSILFDETTWGTYAVEPDNNCYIYLKIPVGSHYVSRIAIGNGSINLPEKYTSFATPESQLYYIGDFSTELELSANVGSMFGLIGALAYEGRDVKVPPFKVLDNYDQTTKYFKKLFPCNDVINSCIIKVDTTYLEKKPIDKKK